MDPIAEARALAALEAVLALPDFQAQAYRRAWNVWMDQLRAWLYQTIVGWVSAVLDAASGQQGVLGYLMLVAAALLLAVGLAAVARAVRQSLAGDAQQARLQAAERRARSDSLWREAQALAAEGRYAEASRALYLSALYALEEHALLRVQEALTNREHAERLARDHPELREVVDGLVQRYDRLRYGGYPASADSFAEMRGLVEQARAASA